MMTIEMLKQYALNPSVIAPPYELMYAVAGFLAIITLGSFINFGIVFPTVFISFYTSLFYFAAYLTKNSHN